MPCTQYACISSVCTAVQGLSTMLVVSCFVGCCSWRLPPVVASAVAAAEDVPKVGQHLVARKHLVGLQQATETVSCLSDTNLQQVSKRPCYRDAH